MARSPAAGATLGVLALQGSFELHLESLERLGAAAKKVRLPADLTGLKGLILPGGESTVMSGVARDSGLFQAIQAAGANGLPLFGTCAGAILLGQGTGNPPRLELAPVTLDRNAYGSQYESFEKSCVLAPFDQPFQCIFIRAPKIRLPSLPPPDLQILGRDGPDIILARYRNLLLATFHPELTGDLRIHRYFLEMIRT